MLVVVEKAVEIMKKGVWTVALCFKNMICSDEVRCCVLMSSCYVVLMSSMFLPSRTHFLVWSWAGVGGEIKGKDLLRGRAMLIHTQMRLK